MTISEISGVLPAQADEAALQKALRSWVRPFLIFGVLSIFANATLDPVWGVVMILVAVLTWKNKLPAMFILFGVLMAWAAVDNTFSVIGGGSRPWWLILVLFQIFWAVSLFRQYRKYRHLHPENEPAILRRFGVTSSIVSVLVLVLPPMIFIGVIVYYASMGEAALMQFTNKIEQSPDQLVSLIVLGLVDSAVLALGLGIAAITASSKKAGELPAPR